MPSATFALMDGWAAGVGPDPRPREPRVGTRGVDAFAGMYQPLAGVAHP